MEIPVKFYFGIEDLIKNYVKDFESFKSQCGTEVDHRVYDVIMLKNHEEVLAGIEGFETHQIEFRIKDKFNEISVHQEAFSGYESISYQDLGFRFKTKQEALYTFKDADIRIFSYFEIKCLLDFYKENDEGKLVFDDYEFILFKLGLKDVIEQLKNGGPENWKLNTKKSKDFEIDPLEFNLNQTDLIHFFDLLVDADLIKEPENEVHKTKGGFYGKLARYFTAKGRRINPKSAKTIKTNKENKGTPYSQTYYEMLKNLKKTIEQKLESKS
ncbi:MAG: hypothetical protein RIB79_11400 [Allomuricauda sp.]|jgi:hypothetical protein